MNCFLAAFGSRLAKWFPALLMMIVIFLFSARASSNLPNFDWADRIVKKSGHIMGYALLALGYWHAFDFKKNKRCLVWLLALLYAMTDEFHQSFSKGRHPSIWDVLVFDNLGVLISLWVSDVLIKTKQPDRENLVAENLNP